MALLWVMLLLAGCAHEKPQRRAGVETSTVMVALLLGESVESVVGLENVADSVVIHE